MIEINSPYAIEYITKNEVIIYENLVYKSELDIPFNGEVFATREEMETYISENNLTIYQQNPDEIWIGQ